MKFKWVYEVSGLISGRAIVHKMIPIESLASEESHWLLLPYPRAWGVESILIQDVRTCFTINLRLHYYNYLCQVTIDRTEFAEGEDFYILKFFDIVSHDMKLLDSPSSSPLSQQDIYLEMR